MDNQSLNSDQLLANWLREFVETLPRPTSFLRITRGTPRFQTRNFFARFKVETARLDGTGQNPTDIKCFVLEVSETNQSAKIAPETGYDTIGDL